MQFSRRKMYSVSIVLIVLTAGFFIAGTFLQRVNGCGIGCGSIPVWTVCSGSSACSLSPSSWYAETVPDTFVFNVHFTSTVPVTVYFLGIQQLVQFYKCSSISCVSGSFQSFPASTSLSEKFTLAEGCGGYVAIFESSASGYISPDVSMTYDPSPSPTGICA